MGFIAHCAHMRDAGAALSIADVIPNTGGVTAGDFNAFMKQLTASEDYEYFLNFMLRNAGSSGAAIPSNTTNLEEMRLSQQIEVAVPEGCSPGQIVVVEYGGHQYECTIPDGCQAGEAFRAAVRVPQLVA